MPHVIFCGSVVLFERKSLRGPVKCKSPSSSVRPNLHRNSSKGDFIVVDPRPIEHKHSQYGKVFLSEQNAQRHHAIVASAKELHHAIDNMVAISDPVPASKECRSVWKANPRPKQFCEPCGPTCSPVAAARETGFSDFATLKVLCQQYGKAPRWSPSYSTLVGKCCCWFRP